MWHPPSLTIIWPPFFRSDMTEEQLVVSTAALALKSSMITRRMALEKMRSIYPFENIETVLEQLDEEAEKVAEHSIESMLSKAMKTDENAQTEPARAEEDEEAPPSR